MEYVIFEIDNDGDAHTVAKFLHMFDVKRAMLETEGNIKPLIGSWLGKLATSYIVTAKDFNDHVLNSGYVNDQDAFLFVRDGHKGRTYARLQLAWELFNGFADGSEEMGEFAPVSLDEAMACSGWTYDPASGEYFVAKGKN